MRQAVIILAAFAALVSPAAARVIPVPDSASTIQAGVDLAANGDTVLVAPGTYYENVSWSGKSITLASHFLTTGDTLYIDSTVIDANSVGSVVYCGSGMDTTALICGFTLRNGSTGNGGGIYCTGASLKITCNIIEDNFASSDGAGIMVMSQGSPVIERNLIRHNQTSTWGGGIYISDGSCPRVRWNVIYDNGVTKSGAASRSDRARIVGGRMVEPGEDAGPLVTNGGGILITNYGGLKTSPIIHNNTIVDNLATGQGGGTYSNRATPDIRNNIIVSNESYGIYSAESTLVCSYNDVWSNTNNYGGAASAGTGALDTCPLFADSVTHDYHLAAGSPCIDAGDPSLPKDPDSTRPDMGAFYSSQTGMASSKPAAVPQRLTVRPNPFAGSAETVTAASLIIYNTTGSLVERTRTGRFGAGLAAGVYFVQAEGFSRTSVVKLERR
jgi:predicted outer membrane repeat protein